ncbi:MAG: HlyD family secretion protein [Verrucomicrobia bacterium]|nr:HlyD family secretion protein [Verrucomicrobiota bacterium]
MEEKQPPFYKEKTNFYYLAGIFLILCIAAFWWWRVYLYPYVSTEDASIASVDHAISPLQSGQILSMVVEDGSIVKKGDLLFAIDDVLLKVEREKAVAALTHARDEVRLQKIQLDLAQEDLKRASVEFAGGVISEEMMQHVEKNYQMAEAQHQSIVSLVAVQEAALNAIDLQLKFAQVTAPIDGVIAKRWHEPGDVVRAGQTVLSLMDLSQIWIAANIEETKLSTIHVGDPVKITVDAYPGIEFQGSVRVIGAAAASQFALIPPNNASGNFTKITQRIPLKISMKPEHAQALYLRPGMSVKVKIRTR